MAVVSESKRTLVQVSVHLNNTLTGIGAESVTVDIGEFEHRGLLRFKSYKLLLQETSDAQGDIKVDVAVRGEIYVELSTQTNPSRCLLAGTQVSPTTFQPKDYLKEARVDLTLDLRCRGQ